MVTRYCALAVRETNHFVPFVFLIARVGDQQRKSVFCYGTIQRNRVFIKFNVYLQNTNIIGNAICVVYPNNNNNNDNNKCINSKKNYFIVATLEANCISS